jgi:type IV fimbrial biogenesis protein FimT
MKTQKGFTLIELLTTLGIATILLSVAVPSMQQFKRNSQQTDSINAMVSVMRLARNTAITTNSRVRVCASRDGATCQAAPWNDGWISFVDADADGIMDGDEQVLQTHSAIDGARITSTQFAGFFVFRPNGRVMNANVGQNNGQFTICDDRGESHSKAIMLDLSGRPRAVDGHSGGGPTFSCS